MAEKTLEQRIASARQAGYSDAEIYDGIKNSPRYQTQFKNSYAKGMTDAQIAGVIGLKLSAHAPQSQSQHPKNTPKSDDIKPEKPSALVRIGSGMDNVFSGAKQLYLYTKDGITGKNEYEEFTAKKKAEKESYQQAKKDSGYTGDIAGIDVAEFLGETVAMGPLATAGKGFQGAKVLSKAGAKVVGQNAGLGAVAGAVGFAENVEKRTDNAVMGAVGGGIGSIVGKKIGDTVTKRMNATTQNIDDTLNRALASNGVKLSDLPENVANNLRSQAKNAVKSGRALDDEAIKNIAFLESKGFKPTKAQATRNATDWTAERELAKRTGTNGVLTEKYVADNTRLKEMLDDEIVATGGKKVDEYGLNQDILQTALGKIESNKAKTRQAYDVANNADGNNVILDSKSFVDEVRGQMGRYGDIFIPDNLKTMLSRIEKDGLSYHESEEMIKYLNGLYQGSLNNGQATSYTHGINQVRQALERYQKNALKGVNSNTDELWNMARQTHKESRQLIDSMPLLKDAEKGVQPDHLFSKHILHGNIAELDNTIKFLQAENPQVVADIKQSIVEHIASKAINPSGSFSPLKMKQALDALGDRRLKTMFSDDELKRLKDIQMAGHLLMQQPVGANVNHSNTASVLANVLGEMLNNVPLINIVKKGRDYLHSHKQLNAKIAGKKNTLVHSPQQQQMIDGLTRLGWITGVNSSGE